MLFESHFLSVPSFITVEPGNFKGAEGHADGALVSVKESEKQERVLMFSERQCGIPDRRVPS
jgi:hypothetical protein